MINQSKFILKIVCVTISMTMKTEVFEIDNILIDCKSY